MTSSEEESVERTGEVEDDEGAVTDGGEEDDSGEAGDTAGVVSEADR